MTTKKVTKKATKQARSNGNSVGMSPEERLLRAIFGGDQGEVIHRYYKASGMDARVKLGDCYLKGIGVEKDAGEAMKLYRKAEEWWRSLVGVGLPAVKESLAMVEKKIAAAEKLMGK